jgi:predicted dehydrogenase
MGRGGVDEVFSGQMRFTGNILAQFDCGFRSPYRASIEIVGTSGALFIFNPFKPGKKEKIQLTRDGERQIIQISGPELYIGEVEDLADAILQKKPPRINLEDSAGNVATIVALLQSAHNGVPISVNF